MRRYFQLILSLSLVIILVIGFTTFTFIAKKYINNEVVDQALNDNKVIGEQIINLLAQTGLAKDNPQTDSVLQELCDNVQLPNGGFICAINPKGNMVAAPGLKPGMTMAFPPLIQDLEKSKAEFRPTKLETKDEFLGYAHFKEEGRTDIVASVPLNDEIRLFVHQNSHLIEEKANQYVKPLLLIGLLITLITGVFTYITTNSIVNRYESKIEKQNHELKKALEEVKQKQTVILSKNEELEEQRKQLQEQHDKIVIQNKEITASINYAKRIQTATLPKALIDNNIVEDHFILFKPRDIVSGDFYWYHDFEDVLVIAAVDCTGHGVPGAFMSMIGITFLNEIVIEKKVFDAGTILDKMRTKVISALDQDRTLKGSSDGMDLALCIIDKQKKNVQYAGAFNPMICIREGQLVEYKADRMPVGIHGKMKEHFTTHLVELKKGDSIYLFSDGYADQFGGKENRKFLSRNFKNLLLELSSFPMNEQEKLLIETLESWQGKIPQVDDILIIGFRIN